MRIELYQAIGGRIPVHTRLHPQPLPGFLELLGGAIQFRLCQLAHQFGIAQVHRVLKQVSGHRTAGFHIGRFADEGANAVARIHRLTQQPVLDRPGVNVSRRQVLVTGQLPLVFIGDRKRHDGLQVQVTLAVFIEQLRCHPTQLEALFHHGPSHPEPGRHILNRDALLYQPGKGHKLIRRVHGLPLDILRQGDFGDGLGIVLDQAGHRVIDRDPLGLGQRLQGPQSASPGDHLEAITGHRHHDQVL